MVLQISQISPASNNQQVVLKIHKHSSNVQDTAFTELNCSPKGYYVIKRCNICLYFIKPLTETIYVIEIHRFGIKIIS